MNATHVMGLGKPEPFGKKSLFQPPISEPPQAPTTPSDKNKQPVKKSSAILAKKSNESERLRTTLQITKKSLSIIYEYQNRYRIQTGHTLPQWKIISEALELYEQAKIGRENEKAK
jgi:hypothetical protein